MAEPLPAHHRIVDPRSLRARGAEAVRRADRERWEVEHPEVPAEDRDALYAIELARQQRRMSSLGEESVHIEFRPRQKKVTIKSLDVPEWLSLDQLRAAREALDRLIAERESDEV